MGRDELTAILDFILNKASEAEFEVIVKACERRRKDAAIFSKIGGSSPDRQAKAMSTSISEAMGASMDSIRRQVRDYVEDIIRKNAPEIPESDLKALLDDYVPPVGTRREAKASPLPPELLAQMARHFVEYSTGRMPPSKQEELWREIPDWQKNYWNAFPAEVRAFVSAFLDGKIDEDTMWGAILGFLGL
jgi:hypothetical protein